MTQTDELYQGREQSRVKHYLLETYLTDLFFKVAQSRKGSMTAINFIDGFSGPWKTQDETNYVDTSFRLAIATFRKVRDNLLELNKERFIVRFIFCEKRKARHQELLKAVADDKDVEIHCIHGEFEDNLGEISGLCKNDFTFTFIDPTGFNIRTKEIASFLGARYGEFLLNYMADHVNRFVEREGLEDAYGSLLADPKWYGRINSPEMTGMKNEEKILVVLRERLKELGCADYVIDFPVLRPREDRIQFRLLLGTRNPSGVSVFRTAQKKAEQFQASVREKIKQDEKTGPDLFNPNEIAAHDLQSDGIDGTMAMQMAPARIDEFLKQRGGQVKYSELIAPILETERLTEAKLKKVLVNMRKMGVIEFELPPGKRVPQMATMIYSGSDLI